MKITTRFGPMEEADLMPVRVEIIDNDREFTVIHEYCLKDCSGSAHETGIHDAKDKSLFCWSHVHRSVSVHLREGIEALTDLGILG